MTTQTPHELKHYDFRVTVRSEQDAETTRQRLKDLIDIGVGDAESTVDTDEDGGPGLEHAEQVVAMDWSIEPALIEATDPAPQPKPYFVMQVPVLSTAHLTEDTCGDWLASRRERYWKDVLDYDDGWFLRIGEKDMPPEWLDDAPDDLRYVVNWFHDEGFDGWLRIDGEIGDVVEGIPTYHWD